MQECAQELETFVFLKEENIHVLFEGICVFVSVNMSDA